MRTRTLPPDPSRLIEGLRDTGYEFHTALADIVDNSVAAGARLVDVRIDMDLAGEISVTVTDNGCGISEEDLDDAMKYGSRSRPSPFSLGKFGLGLKTASTAFCRRLSVITRNGGESEPARACWDLDHIAEVKEWELMYPDVEEYHRSLLDEVTGGGSGTLVLWENVDRVLKDYSNPAGEPARKALDLEIERFKQHAAMVYQRFLDPEDDRAEHFELVVNDEKIEAWDPFCTSEPATELAVEADVPVELADGSEATFTMRAYVLPRREEFSSGEAEKNARISNDLQGLYIYREDRLIHSGGWLRMFRREPHYSLLRVEFSFNCLLDEAFHIDIKKSQVSLNEVLYKFIKDQFLPSPRRAAADVYRKGQRKLVEEASKGAHSISNKGIGAKEGEVVVTELEVEDAATGQIKISNPKGTIRIKSPVLHPEFPGDNFVQTAEQVEDGLLWEPCVIDGHPGVRINTGHPYYAKIYVPNLASGVTIQGMDSLLWALCQAEWATVSDSTAEHCKELRYEVSRILRKLVESLPEPLLEEDDD